jgi:hypothetical protein
MNIIRQAGASIGTAVLSVILASAITSNLSGIIGSHASGSGSGLATLSHLPPSAHAVIAGPLADAFGSTFVWAFALVVVALIPAVGMALSGRRQRVTAPVGSLRVAQE